MKDKLTLVLYIGIAKVRSADIDDYILKIVERITPSIENSEIIVIPCDATNTRIECINPKYIIEEELINKNKTLMYELNNELQKQLNYIKDGK